MHPLAMYLTAVQATTDHDLMDDDLQAWSRRQANAPRDETPASGHRRIVTILRLGFALRARRSARSAERSA